MKLPSEASLLRIFIDEGDKCGGRPLCEVVVETVRKKDLGCYGFEGISGFWGQQPNTYLKGVAAF